jgi:urocanate hydratase
MSKPIELSFRAALADIQEAQNLADFQAEILEGIPNELPEAPPSAAEGVLRTSSEPAHAPKRLIEGVLSKEEKALAVANALRYFPKKHHAILAKEFAEELTAYGRIYMHRFRPKAPIYARPLGDYPSNTPQAAAIMLMIQNNLDPSVAKHPHELITYGGNGAVFQNWAQYRLCMRYLAEMTDEQTLVLYSGHPLGLFPSSKEAPRVVVTNGMMIPNYSKKEDWNRYNALGVTQYGQMTAGSFMYIGPQGIVHGTTLTILNAGRLQGFNSLAGKLFVTSGLGGMSGAQALAAAIVGCIGVIAEVDAAAIQQRVNDGYVQKELIFNDLDTLMRQILFYQNEKRGVSLIYQGNIVDLWERLDTEGVAVALGSDQTSLHNIDDCGYTPVGYTFEEAKALLIADKKAFKEAVQTSLRRHVAAINRIVERCGMYFFDYGNAFLKEAGDAKAAVFKNKKTGTYRYPSYVQDIMGPLCFDYGFGPFRWVCTSGLKSDLDTTDRIAAEILRGQIANLLADTENQKTNEIPLNQLKDNLLWIEEADRNIPIVGSKARILYADANCRILIAEAFNKAIAAGTLSAPIVLGRDHHDVSGTDSPYRETANIYDGSRFTADMAVQNFVGDAFRGATWVSLHNGGGVGWGEVINGGFGLVLDGSAEASRRLASMLFWDVNNGIARRAWARNVGALATAEKAMQTNPDLKLTLPNLVEADILRGLF